VVTQRGAILFLVEEFLTAYKFSLLIDCLFQRGEEQSQRHHWQDSGNTAKRGQVLIYQL